MATLDLSKLQEILANAEVNEAIIAQVRKNFTQVTHLVDEISAMLEPGYTVAKKERKPRDPNATGKRPGRPKKNQTAE